MIKTGLVVALSTVVTLYLATDGPLADRSDAEKFGVAAFLSVLLFKLLK